MDCNHGRKLLHGIDIGLFKSALLNIASSRSDNFSGEKRIGYVLSIVDVDNLNSPHRIIVNGDGPVGGYYRSNLCSFADIDRFVCCPNDLGEVCWVISQ